MLDINFINEIFNSFNQRAQNGVFDTARVRRKFLKICDE